jgi:hypothetical protein
MDETQSLAPMLAVGGKLDAAKSAVEAIRLNARNPNSITIAADANADTLTRDLFKAAGQDIKILEVRGLKPYKRFTAQVVASVSYDDTVGNLDSYVLDEHYAAAHIAGLVRGGHGVAVACSHASHAKRLARVLRGQGARVELLTGDMPEGDKRRAPWTCSRTASRSRAGRWCSCTPPPWRRV